MNVPASQINLMDQKVIEAGDALVADYQHFEKLTQVSPQWLYNKKSFECRLTHDMKLYDSYWHHPDHLVSSSYITNLRGVITQHMEYLPFGETLVEEHLNSNNSPYKFNAARGGCAQSWESLLNGHLIGYLTVYI